MTEQGWVKVRFDFKLDDITYNKYYKDRRINSYPKQVAHRATVVASDVEAAKQICAAKYPDWWAQHEVEIASVRPA